MTTASAAPLAAPRPALPPALVAALRSLFGERFSTATAVCEQHGRDESPFEAMPPDAVVWAESAEEVTALLEVASRWGVPVIPFGAGSSLEGHLLAVRGGISLDLSRMDAILRIDAEDLTVTVQPGVTRLRLNQELRHAGLFFPVDPGADATIGGMTATRASGTNAVRYGTMRENVLALEVVLADGQRIRTGSRARKSAAGYDLTRLFVGSEGTLGVITEITLRLHPLPEAVSAAICHFPDLGSAVDTTIAIIQAGVPIARCELLDTRAVRAVNAHDRLGLRESPMLLMEFHGSPASVAEQASTAQTLAREHGGEAFEWATTPEERSRLWAARHHAYLSALQTRPGCRSVTTDACVPISRLTQCLTETVAEADASGLPYFLVGHVGDGNFHIGYLIDPNLPAEREQAEQLNRRLVERALQLEGTCSGEHGIGLHKIDFLPIETGAGAVDLMRRLKLALDPAGVLNPGKIFRAS